MAFNVARIGGTLVQLFSTLSVGRAVEAQAKVTGGAMNTAAQSSVQTEQDRLKQKRQARLLGRSVTVDATAALEPTHTATGEDDHSPSERRDYLFMRRRRPGRGQQQHHGERDDKAPDFYDAGEHGDKA